MKTDVENAIDTDTINKIDSDLVTLSTRLTEYKLKIIDLINARSATITVFTAYSSVLVVFLSILTSTADMAEFLAYTRDNINSFYVLEAGTVPNPAISSLSTLPTPRTVRALKSYFEGAALQNLYTLIGSVLTAKIDEFAASYAPSAAIFTRELATKGRLGPSPSSSLFASAPAVASKIATDKNRITVAIAPDTRNADTLAEIMQDYFGIGADPGLLNSIRQITNYLTTGESERTETIDVMIRYYSMYLPFSGSGELLENPYSNTLLNTIRIYLNPDTSELQDAFYAQTNDQLNALETAYTSGCVIENPTSEDKLKAEAIPSPLEALIITIRRKMYSRIIDFKSKLSTNQIYFTQAGANLTNPKLNPITALSETGYIAKDLVDIRSMPIKDLKLVVDLARLQNTYKDLLSEFESEKTRLMALQNLRIQAAENARKFRDTYLDYKDKLLKSTSYISEIEGYFDTANQYNYKTTFTTISSETLQTFVNNYTSPNGSAYASLLANLRTALTAALNAFITLYNDNKSNIEANGALIPGDLIGIVDATKTLISSVGTKTFTDIKTIQDDYIRLSGLVSNCSGAGATLITARTNLNDTVSVFKSNHAKFKDDLLSGKTLLLDTNRAIILAYPPESTSSGITEYLYTNNNLAMSDWYKSLPATSNTSDSVASIKTDFETKYPSALKSDVIKFLLAVIDAFNTKYTNNLQLFNDVKSIDSTYTVPLFSNYGINITADKATVNSTNPMPSFDTLESIKDRYISANIPLNDDITTANTKYNTYISQQNASVLTAVIDAMSAYIDLYTRYADFIPTIPDLVVKFQKYIDVSKNPPFTAMFNSEIKTKSDYERLRDEYITGKTLLEQSIKSSLSAMVSQFFSSYDIYKSSSSDSASLSSVLKAFYDSTNSDRANAAQVLFDKTANERSAIIAAMKQFIDQMDLYIKNDMLKRCINKEIAGKTTPLYALKLFKSLF
jgi:hypothetical protein